MDIKRARLMFATKYHRNTNDHPMDFSQCHYMKGLYESLAPEIVVLGGTQVMKSEWLLIDHLATAYCGYSVFFVLRNHDAKDTYVQNRINKVLEAVPFYRQVMKDSTFDRLDIKKFGKGQIKYVGSGIEADFREYPAAAMFVDELNDCNWSNVRFGFSRMDGNVYKFKRFVSNSKTKEHPAEQLLQESTNQDWQVPCVGCGKTHRLDWFETVVNAIEDAEGNVVDYTLKDREWRPGCGRDIVCVCPRCGGALDRLSPSGLWIPKNPDAKMEGFHVPSLCSSIASVSELWKEFQMGINNPHEMQLFFTRRLAVPYSTVGSKVTGSVMDKCKGNYNMILRPDRAFISGDSCEGPCTMGVDVGSEKLDVRISKMLNGNKRQAVFIGKIDTKNIDELNDLIARYHVEKVVIDIQPEQALVTQFQETCEADVWLVKLGRKDQTKTENVNWNRKIISHDRTEVLDRTYAQLQSGKNILPDNYADIFGGNYISEMSSPIREMHLDKDGNPIFIWESDGKDHQRFADAYDYLAMRLLNEDGSYITSDCIYDYTKSV